MPPEALLVGLHTVAAGASLFLSFLPLLPPQILFTNLPEIIIGTDNVEAEAIERLAK